jgi:hypothetical protein
MGLMLPKFQMKKMEILLAHSKVINNIKCSTGIKALAYYGGNTTIIFKVHSKDEIYKKEGVYYAPFIFYYESCLSSRIKYTIIINSNL